MTPHARPDGPFGTHPAEVQAGRLERVMREFSQRLEDGERIDDALLEHEYADLMPQLGEYVRDLRALLALRSRAANEADALADAFPQDAAADDLRVLRESLRRYDVLERVRHGGQGVVYRARQRGTNRIVAIKVLLDGPLSSERQQQRFQREIELISRLRHPNIVAVHESGAVRGRNYYVMEFVEGCSIDDYVVLQDLPPREIVRLMVKVCGAVHHAHQNGVIHRDLNPANILVDEHGEPRVYDFGLAKDLRTPHDAAYTHTGVGVGTPPYLSPEQAGGGDQRTDVRTDVYALGLILYELLTDALPYPAGEDPAVIRDHILHREPVPLRQAVAAGGWKRAPGLEQVNADLEAIVGQALAKAKSDRYQSVDRLLADLESWLRGEAVSAMTHRPWYRLRKLTRRYRVPLAFAAVLLLALLVAATAITVSWIHARAQRDVARQAAALAFDLFDNVLTEVEEAVRPLPGGVAVRDRLIDQLAERQEELAVLVQGDPALDAVRSRLLEKQGDLALRQEELAGARQYYRLFLEKSLLELSRHRSDPGAWATAIRAYRQMTSVADAPGGLFEAGGALGEQSLEKFPADQRPRYEHCRLLLEFGDYLENEGRHASALAQYQRASDLCAGQESAGESRLRWAALAAQALNGEGSSLIELGYGREGRFALERSAAIREGLLAENPSNTEVRFALLCSYEHLGTLSRESGDLVEAKRLLETSAQQGELLGMMDALPPSWQAGCYSVHHRLADVCLRLGQLEEAAAHARKALRLAESLARSATDESVQTTLHYARMLQARILRASGAWEAALELYLSTRERAEERLARQPSDLELHSQAADAHDCVGYCERKLGRLSEAIASRERGLALRRAIALAEPQSVTAALNVVQMITNLGETILDLESEEASEKVRNLVYEAETLLRHLNSSGRLIGWQRRQEHLESRIAEIHARLRHGQVHGKDAPLP